MRQIHDNLWILTYPLSILGTHHGRTVTLIRLKSGKTILHSMAPFPPEDMARIREIGDPSWLVEAMLLHDTYARQGRELFPERPFYGPEGFGEVVKFETLSLRNPPQEWADEVEVIGILGAPKLKEHVFIHKPSRTLIVADLVFNFPPQERGWDRFFHRHIAGFKRYPGMSRIFRLLVQDRPAFKSSIARVMDTDFDRIIVGHGQVVETNGKELLRRGLTDAGLWQ